MENIQYQVKGGGKTLFGVDVEVAAKELERIRVKHGGALKPGDVVAAAKNPKNPLHPAFEWDESKAAHAHWLHHARQLIKSIEFVVVRDEKRSIAPAFLSVPTIGPVERHYQSITVLATKPDQWKLAIADLQVQVDGLRSTIRSVIDLAGQLGRDPEKIREASEHLERAGEVLAQV